MAPDAQGQTFLAQPSAAMRAGRKAMSSTQGPLGLRTDPAFLALSFAAPVQGISRPRIARQRAEPANVGLSSVTEPAARFSG